MIKENFSTTSTNNGDGGEALPLKNRLKTALTGKEPNLHRGISGLPMYTSRELTENQEALLSALKYKSLEQFNKYNLIQRDSPSLERKVHLEELRLIHYFAKFLARGTLGKANFNTDKSQAHGWSTMGGRTSAHMGFDISYINWSDDGEVWASGVLSLIQSLGFVLKTRATKDQVYEIDSNEDERMGMQTKMSMEQAEGVKWTSLIDTAYYQKIKCGPGHPLFIRIQPLLNFQAMVSRRILELGAETTMQDIIEIFRDSYEETNLAEVIKWHRKNSKK